MPDKPKIIVVAGPNGAGKSTAASRLVHEYHGISDYVVADTIARGLAAFDSESVAIEAGRIMLAYIRRLADRRVSFAFETTLATRSFHPWLRGLVESGYELHLYFIWLPSAGMAIERVRHRKAMGGHSIKREDIERRYVRGARNFFELYQPLAASWSVFDNSSEIIRAVASGAGRSVIMIEEEAVWEKFKRLGGQ
jgi:predicted ABC-type ATPase